MKLSTRSRYALRMMIDIARHGGEGVFVPIRDVAERQAISGKYLEQIVGALTRTGMLTSSRGAQGGYALNREAKEYTAGDIVRAIEGNLAPVACLETERKHCPRKGDCETLGLWTGLHAAISTYLDSVTLADLLDWRSNEHSKKRRKMGI